MSLQNFTIKSQEIFQQAQQLAFNAKNPNIETEHILKALLNEEDSPVEYLLKKNNVMLLVLIKNWKLHQQTSKNFRWRTCTIY